MDDNKLKELSSNYSWATAAFMAQLSEKCYLDQTKFKDEISVLNLGLLNSLILVVHKHTL